MNTRKNSIILCKRKERTVSYIVYIKGITEKEEHTIDANKAKYKVCNYTTDDGKSVSGDDIYMYGEVNLNNKEDLELIDRFNLVSEDGVWAYANFDYEKGTVTTKDGVLQIKQIYDCLEWFKYCYCLIGKPERIIVYRIKGK